MVYKIVYNIRIEGENMSNPVGRPRKRDSWDKDVLCVRYHRAKNSPPSKQTIKDIEKWINKMKWLEKIRWKTKKRTTAIEEATNLLQEHKTVVKEEQDGRWVRRYVANMNTLTKEEVLSFAPTAKAIVRENSSVQGFTLLPTEKAHINQTVVPLLDLRNKYSGKTICIYKDYLDGTKTLQDYYVD